ncbi:hypothetical protein CTI12_AA063140 [Artemisia annua]|uniref:Uncharacterized protein n=1 Tax=Artemisia annua TaxID=35608 RepID=A0A2U1Q853_ARTAN|nr:hypothetical protein CTI12_AA063140 [Artemisia annua]
MSCLQSRYEKLSVGSAFNRIENQTEFLIIVLSKFPGALFVDICWILRRYRETYYTYSEYPMLSDHHPRHQMNLFKESFHHALYFAERLPSQTEMSARGHGQPAYASRSTQPLGTQHPQHPERGDSKLVGRSAEIERLASDKQKLSASHIALRQELATTLQDIQKLRAHIGSIQTECDLQIRILLEKMAKMEVHIRAGENVKKDLQRAHAEARALVATRQELINQVEQATQELKKARADVEKLPEMNAELDRLTQEHQKLRLTFEHEKSLNNEKATQMELMEKDLVGMAKEVERLRAEIQNAEKRANGIAFFLLFPFIDIVLF